MIYIIRFLSAFTLFAFLAKANIWLDPISNIILVLGYRLLLVFAPILVKLVGKNSATYSFGLSFLGTLLWMFSTGIFLQIAVFFIGFGISIGGYLIKAQAAETPEGAGFNKIALNFGSFLSGLAVAFIVLDKFYFLFVCSIILFLCMLLSALYIGKETKTTSNINLKNYKFTATNFAWSLIGISIGIKLFSVFAILPQILLSKFPILPSWYGTAISLNSITVVLIQIPLIIRIKNAPNPDLLSFKALLFGMAILLVPCFFKLTNIYNAMTWIFVCSIIECFASYLDVTASKYNALLYKEASVGIGAAFTVGIMRLIDVNISPIILSVSGFVFILIGLTILKISQFKLNIK